MQKLFFVRNIIWQTTNIIYFLFPSTVHARLDLLLVNTFFFSWAVVKKLASNETEVNKWFNFFLRSTVVRLKSIFTLYNTKVNKGDTEG